MNSTVTKPDTNLTRRHFFTALTCIYVLLGAYLIIGGFFFVMNRLHSGNPIFDTLLAFSPLIYFAAPVAAIYVGIVGIRSLIRGSIDLWRTRDLYAVGTLAVALITLTVMTIQAVIIIKIIDGGLSIG